jgi:hypothetical protein
VEFFEGDVPHEAVVREKKVLSEILARTAALEQGYEPIIVEEYEESAKMHVLYKNYVLSGKPLLIPAGTLHAKEFVNAATIFNYDPFDEPKYRLHHELHETVLIFRRLRNIFDFEFTDGNNTSRGIDEKIFEFLAKNEHAKTILAETSLLRNFFNKLMIALHTSEEFYFRNMHGVMLNKKFVKCIEKDIEGMNRIQSSKGTAKTLASWRTFRDILCDFNGNDSKMYVHTTNEELNDKMVKAFETEQLTEGFFAATLKCYYPAIALDYFYAIRSAYVMARLVAIYVNKFKGKMTKENHVKNLYIVAAAATIGYENKYHLLAQIMRGVPQCMNRKLTERTQAYYANHTFAGPQYLLLKMLEKCIPVLGTGL